jgi:hypothetical protein
MQLVAKDGNKIDLRLKSKKNSKKEFSCFQKIFLQR